ncbi:hypothetical protein KIW84_072173 [Lathyrus oleraceus]|uniref:DUF155 domain-containing protein n=1 Tax=Pisum sativum TaxID=3888 RepID=A0A9D4VLE5_PEA|nr:hypothetical protein KIW84_072173 [Pisum sativum]
MIPSKVTEYGSNGRTVPSFFPWLDYATKYPLSELFKARPPLWNTALQSESFDDDELEHFEDVIKETDKEPGDETVPTIINSSSVVATVGDIAWKDAKYGQIWEYLRDEFELTQRFASLDFKLKFVEHNIRFLQEILQNRKSDFLEWLIITLIGAEILMSLYDIVQRSAMSL